MPRAYLVSRTLDPVLGIISGLWAYGLYESRLQPPRAPGHSLPELLVRKWDERTLFKSTPAAGQPTSAKDDDESWRELQEEIRKASK